MPHPMNIPVFLPGNSRDWHEVAGMGLVHEDGRIEIQLQNPEHARELVRLAVEEKRVYAISIDYNDEQAPEHIPALPDTNLVGPG